MAARTSPIPSLGCRPGAVVEAASKLRGEGTYAFLERARIGAEAARAGFND